MQDKHLYEYAIIRLVPKVEREEFINIGILLLCKKSKMVLMAQHLNTAKINCIFEEFDSSEIKKQLHSFELIARGNKEGGPIALMDAPSRFRWMTAARSSILQTSRVHPGLCDDLNITMDKLMQQLVF